MKRSGNGRDGIVWVVGSLGCVVFALGGCVGDITGDGSGDESTGNVDPIHESVNDHSNPQSICGDGEITVGEICDDGGTEDGDGCSADCAKPGCLVPVTHETIGAGIADGGCPVVYVLPGRYEENLIIDRDVVLTDTAAGPAIIDGGFDGTVVEIASGDVTIVGMTITRGLARRGAGIYVDGADASVVLIDATVERNAAYGPTAGGAGIFTAGGTVTLQSSLVGSNQARGTSTGAVAIATGGGIHCDGGQVSLSSGSLVNDNVVVVDHAGAGSIGGGIFAQSCDVSIFDGSIVGGNRVEANGAAWARAEGGGVLVADGQLVIRHGSVSSNVAEASSEKSATTNGGGISALNANLALAVATVSDNTATASGDVATVNGAGVSSEMFRTYSGWLEMHESVVEGNAAIATATTADGSSVSGGAIRASADDTSRLRVQLTNDTISGNVADIDAGLAFGGALAIVAPSADATAVLQISSSTVVYNAALGDSRGGAVYLLDSVATLRNSIVYGNKAASSRLCYGKDAAVRSAGYNLYEAREVSVGCALVGNLDADLIDVDPLLSPLDGYGGWTVSHALEPSSPAIDAGDPAGCANHLGDPVRADQRGELRTVGPCDIGAYERID